MCRAPPHHQRNYCGFAVSGRVVAAGVHIFFQNGPAPSSQVQRWWLKDPSGFILYSWGVSDCCTLVRSCSITPRNCAICSNFVFCSSFGVVGRRIGGEGDPEVEPGCNLVETTANSNIFVFLWFSTWCAIMSKRYKKIMWSCFFLVDVRSIRPGWVVRGDEDVFRGGREREKERRKKKEKQRETERDRGNRNETRERRKKEKTEKGKSPPGADSQGHRFTPLRTRC